MSMQTIFRQSIANAADLREALDEIALFTDLRVVTVSVGAEGIADADEVSVVEETLTDGSIVHNLMVY